MSGSPTYFELLGLAPQFDIDLKTLETAYFREQRRHHPDRFAGRPAHERQEALFRSGDINTAYNTLKNPLGRAQYLLHLQGIAVGTEADSARPSQQVLVETMEWREQIAGVQDAQAAGKLETMLDALHTQSVAAIAQAYAREAWDDMTQETLRLGYIAKAQEAVLQQKKYKEKQAL